MNKPEIIDSSTKNTRGETLQTGLMQQLEAVQIELNQLIPNLKIWNDYWNNLDSEIQKIGSSQTSQLLTKMCKLAINDVSSMVSNYEEIKQTLIKIAEQPDFYLYQNNLLKHFYKLGNVFDHMHQQKVFQTYKTKESFINIQSFITYIERTVTYYPTTNYRPNNSQEHQLAEFTSNNEILIYGFLGLIIACASIPVSNQAKPHN